jgi:hypothetical protein
VFTLVKKEVDKDVKGGNNSGVSNIIMESYYFSTYQVD